MVQFILLITFVSIVLTYYFLQKQKIKREEVRERMREKRQELLERTIRTKMDKSTKGDDDSDEDED